VRSSSPAARARRPTSRPGRRLATGAPAAVTGELRQFRGNAAQRLVQITLRTTAPLTVASGSLSAEGFQDGPLRTFDLTLPAGAVIDLPVEYGAADCRATPGAARALLSGAPGRAPPRSWSSRSTTGAWWAGCTRRSAPSGR
jgi:hypothetical protein